MNIPDSNWYINRSGRSPIRLYSADNDEVLEVDEDYIYRGMPGLSLWMAPENLDAWGYPKFNPALPRSEFYGKPEVFQAPRAIQLGVRITI